MFVINQCFISDSADNSATADTPREVLVVGPNDGQLREEVSGRFRIASAVLRACQLCLQVRE